MQRPASPSPAIAPPRPKRRRRFLSLLYTRAILHEFRWTLFALLLCIALGGIIFAYTPEPDLDGACPDWHTSFYCAWMALLGEPVFPVPPRWWIAAVHALYPLLGFLIIGEGIVRFALLMLSRRHGEKEWMRVMASTCHDHIVLCGIGHLGFRVLEQLVAAKLEVVAIEKDGDGRFIAMAKNLGVPVLIRDMKEDQSLIDAGIQRARAIIIATNDDMANLEVALDARRLNPHIRVLMRLFDQQIAGKIADAIMVDAAFSSSALAAPLVAALSLETRVLSSIVIAGVPHITSEVSIASGSSMAGRRIDEIELGYTTRILARTPANGPVESPPSPATRIEPGDTLILHCRDSQLTAIAAAARG